MKPLQGKRILDLTNVLAGPFCTYQLANLGAEVLKIETPVKGDLARNLGADPDLNSKGMGISFLAQNSGKKSITLNLKSKKGKILFRELVSEYDAVVENFRPGVMKRLDLSYESLKKNNSKWQYTFWHNRFFNPSLSEGIEILNFSPEKTGLKKIN